MAKLTIPDTSKARVLVVGDVMLDRYWFGDVERISPEAPVPVVRVQRTEERPGGAANVARNGSALGATVSLLSVVGDDEAALALGRLVSEAGVRSLMQKDAGLSTTIKLRVLGRQQQLLRIDFENTPSADVLKAKLDSYKQELANHDVVVLSDYGKGGLTLVQDMIDLARAAGKPVLVDPKGEDYSRYKGASLLTPNRSELRQVVGRWKDDADLSERAQKLRKELGLDALLVTRSEEGMTLFREQGTVHEGTRAQEVFDVSGAGDTVIATLAVMIASGCDLVTAMRLSNHAAGIVVGKLGTATVTLDEMRAEF
ncbi:D-glycero-beta-D-manno-heptose-7-phosphate kinase [Uliginosibacterium sp. H3]|uniref:D-glycero-beta-D-manno-heptose-7-phosphate kinase n=1 Tax=Uliginosibacterium silvisoli TaxID=3114758 RepID=A0ABU6K8N4_9RHOO|nr:D-glycero-beta-D-manno-heptose-7-phosphate kinase [Uliginosibacterium sp. H3]